MIKLFRRIRHQLFSESNISKYLLYALGEILLVVIGILIALQINNWNESRINDRQEQLVLETLKREITENQSLLSIEIANYTECLKLLKELNTFISPDPGEIGDIKLDSLMYGLGWIPQYLPKDGVLNSIIASGKISLIKNNELSSMLSSMSGLLNGYRTSFEWTVRDVFEHILPYIKSKYPLKRTLKYFGEEIKEESKFNFSKEGLLSDLGFETLVSNRIIDARDLLLSAQVLYDFQGQILELIENELNK